MELDRDRRALSHVGGAVRTVGDAVAARQLAHALEVPPSGGDDEEGIRAHVHGFHTYPARLHPGTAARLVQAFVPPGGRVLDPFCGSGTVLVEGMILGRSPLGTDLNPLAVRLTRCKTRPRDEAELERLVGLARNAVQFAHDRRKAKAGATRRFPPEDVALFEPHVLLELDSLRSHIESLAEEPLRYDLSLVLSAVLVKLSGKRADTSEAVTRRRTAAGFAAKLFLQKTEDLARRLGEFSRLLPPGTARPVVAVDDATRLESLPAGKLDAIVTSPPYAATYDYVAHHALRLRWLGLESTDLARGELGARSAYRKIPAKEATATWAGELGRFLTAAARVLPTGGSLVLVMADSAVGTVALRADEIVAEVGKSHGFSAIACASQDRPHFHSPTSAAFRHRPRAEHAILLQRTGPGAGTISWRPISSGKPPTSGKPDPARKSPAPPRKPLPPRPRKPPIPRKPTP